STVAADPGNTLVTKDFLTSAGNAAVSTNASLSGDGTSGSPLGVNLASANEWSATQTLPATAAQGDNLIASVNAGAGAVNAARIGNGLTDAQVNDNLTINGGTVDGTPIGATTPSTGAFTNLTAASVNVTTLSLTGKATSASTVAADPGNTLVTKDFLTSAGNAAVSTNASLSGDGTSGSPLGVNLANANAWSATQTLPATAAQGNTLIASVNAGASAVNAARIGNGLTDAQVNDNLTISGGTVNNTPIGATTPSTGAFTTIAGTALPSGSSSTSFVVSNAGALETRTAASLVGSFPVSVGASISGDGTVANPLLVNLAHANTWTATQTLPATAAQGDALIASANSGSTALNAARIGNGLTDAQVNDNLTISGGTVNNSPVGAVTASTGRFTTSEATTTLGPGVSPARGTSYRDNAIVAWGSVDANGTYTNSVGNGGSYEFGNGTLVHTGPGTYTITLPATTTAGSTIVTLQSIGFVTVTQAGTLVTISTFNQAGFPTDMAFYFQTVTRQ
ncbi:MAG TPA: hypothetical protein VHI13_06045, partial [Candidatus Kapabacteria bacterium]|nr:hypothetical protein [Candidatus Kapabacteria bacterium]